MKKSYQILTRKNIRPESSTQICGTTLLRARAILRVLAPSQVDEQEEAYARFRSSRARVRRAVVNQLFLRIWIRLTPRAPVATAIARTVQPMEHR